MVTALGEGKTQPPVNVRGPIHVVTGVNYDVVQRCCRQCHASPPQGPPLRKSATTSPSPTSTKVAADASTWVPSVWQFQDERVSIAERSLSPRPTFATIRAQYDGVLFLPTAEHELD